MPIYRPLEGIAAGWTQLVNIRGTSLLFHPYVLFVALALAAWLPDGFSIGPFMSDDLMLFMTNSGSRHILDAVHTRILRDIPTWIGLHLTPHGFQGWQAVVLVLTVLRAILMYEIVRRMLPGNRLFALLCGLFAAFHPADSGYFWLNSTGAKFGLVLSLAAALCALAYLEKGGWLTLSLMFLLQLMAGFTYPGYFLLMLAIPVGAWILRRMEGAGPGFVYLAKISPLILLIGVFDVISANRHMGWDYRIANPSLALALAGYGSAIQQNLFAFFDLLSGFKLEYVVPALIIALFASAAAWRLLRSDGADNATMPWPRVAVVVCGFLGLALLSYLPYSITYERFDDRRQLYGMGLFTYGAFLFLLCTVLTRYIRSRAPLLVVAALVGGVATVAALEKRVYPIAEYRNIESVLGAIATAAPNPKPHSFILVHLPDKQQATDLAYIYRSDAPFSSLLRFMYRDRTLAGAFYGFGKSRSYAGADGMHVYPDHGMLSNNFRVERHGWRREIKPEKEYPSLTVPYERLVLLEYRPSGEAALLDRNWLAADAPSKIPVAKLGYTPPDLGLKPPHRALICSLLESRFRPAYCSTRSPTGPAKKTAGKSP